MTYVETTILGVVEGLTEFLPISSTGHLILTGHFMQLADTPEAKVFDVVIQAGAIFAVVVYYWKELLQMLKLGLGGDSTAMGQMKAVLVAFLPAAIIGLVLHKWIKAHLFGSTPVIFAMITGGVAMILIERKLKRQVVATQASNEPKLDLPLPQALKIGFFQCLAMWPGTSRSMVTILGGRLTGLSTVSAAVFSFYLAIPTIIGASVFDLMKSRAQIGQISPEFAQQLILGTLVSFVVALLVIHAFLGYLRRYSLEAFGWYRIIAGLVLWIAIGGSIAPEAQAAKAANKALGTPATATGSYVGCGPALRFTMSSIDGQIKNLCKTYQGKVTLVVNVASRCGYTPQYSGLEDLYTKYKSKGFRIAAFPANNFGSQEPGTNNEIKKFCSTKYNVTFDLFEKSDVAGATINPLYRYLTEARDGYSFSGPITWNFNKFLVDRHGNVVGRFDSKITPESDDLRAAVEKALNGA